MSVELVVGLAVDEVPVGLAVEQGRVDASEIQDGASTRHKTVGPPQSNLVSQETRACAGRIERLSCRARIVELEAKPGSAVTHQVVPALGCLVLYGHSVISVLLFLEGVIRYAVQIESVRQSQRRSRAPQGEPNLSRAGRRPAKVVGIGRIVESAVRFTVLRIETGKVRKVVKRPARSGDRHLLALGAEISAIDRVAEFRQASVALPCTQAYDARQCVSSIQNAVGSSQDFNLVNSRGRKIPEFNPPADVVQRNPVEQYFVGVWVPASHKEVRRSAPWASLEDLNPRN